MSEESAQPIEAVAQASEPVADQPSEVQTESKSEVVANGNNGTEGVNGDSAKTDSSTNEEDHSAADDDTVPPPNRESEGAETKANMSSDGEAKAGDDNGAAADAGVPEGAPDATQKSKSRRKSGVPEHRGKKPNRKSLQLQKTLHLHAKPGEYYLVKLKGYPNWPAVICDEAMLPNALISTRPQTAARIDGTYREEYADDGKRAKERTYPVMFMATNEFAWTPNTDLRPFHIDEAKTFPTSRTKNLNLAYQLACEEHPLSHWKQVLHDFQEQAQQAAEEQAARLLQKEEKEKKKAAKKSSKKVEEGDVADDGDEDASMALDVEGGAKKKKSQKKRELAEGDSKTETPATKKIKLNLSSKSTNGTPGSAKPKAEKKESAAKPKRAAKQKEAVAEPAKPAEPELTPEEQRTKKEREILFLRHKLQKGLLSKDTEPEESQMPQMAEYITKLEGYPDLEVSIIKTTKINKVLKAILKIETIPMEAEYNFKTRSSQLLSKWNHILESAPKEASAAAATNGLTNGDAKSEHGENQDIKEEPKATNGIKTEEAKTDEDVEMKDAVAVDADTVKSEEGAVAPVSEEAKDTDIPDAPPAIESTS